MRSALFTIGFVAMGLLVLVSAGCKNDSSNSYGAPTSPSSTPPVNVPANTILMSGMTFSPSTITVTVGTTLTWKNNDGIAHTSTSDTGVWDTGNLAAGGSSSTTFNTAGTFPYHCTYHVAMGMKGTVIVQ
jgi:plastocyanin